MNELLNKLKKFLKIPKEYNIFLTPGSCTGAMESVIWSVLNKETNITSIVYDFWGIEWSRSIEKLNLKQEIRSCLNGKMPNLENININDDIVFLIPRPDLVQLLILLPRLN